MDKAEQKRLLIEMMNEDAKDGLYLKTAEEILQHKFAGLESKINKPNVYQVPLILAAMEEYANQFKAPKIKNELKYSTPEQLGK